MTARSAPIVVGYTDSEPGRHALTVAARLAGELGADLIVVHVIDLRDYPIDPDASDWEDQGVAHLERQRADVDRLLAGWSGSWSYDLASGDPAQALSAQATAAGARMIVVGTRGMSVVGTALERLLGAAPSVVHGLERAHIPVLVVPRPPAGEPTEI